MKYYHVTLKGFAANICEYGIDPNWSSGSQALSWYVTGARLYWAIAHMAAKYHCPISDLVVFELSNNSSKHAHLERTRLDGVWVCAVIHKPKKAPRPALDYLNMDLIPYTTPGAKRWRSSAIAAKGEVK